MTRPVSGAPTPTPPLALAVAWVFFACSLFFATACSGRNRSRKPTVAAVAVNSDSALERLSRPFVDVGCRREASRLDCTKAEPLAGLDCDLENVTLEPDFVRLTPTRAIAICPFLLRRRAEPAESATLGVLEQGCRMKSYRRFLVADHGTYRLLTTRDDVQKAFAPVETPDEAIAFAMALTDSFAIRSRSALDGMRLLVPRFELTSPKRTASGYAVRLFVKSECGCGPHSVSAVDLQVTTSGTVEEVASKEVYQDPRLDDTCID